MVYKEFKDISGDTIAVYTDNHELFIETRDSTDDVLLLFRDTRNIKKLIFALLDCLHDIERFKGD